MYARRGIECSIQQARDYLPSWAALSKTATAALATAIGEIEYATKKVEHLVRANQLIQAPRGQIDLESLANWMGR